MSYIPSATISSKFSCQPHGRVVSSACYFVYMTRLMFDIWFAKLAAQVEHVLYLGPISISDRYYLVSRHHRVKIVGISVFVAGCRAT